MDKPILLRVDGAKLPSGNKYLPNPLKDKQVVILLSVEGQFVRVKRGKDISVFHNSYFQQV